MFFFPSSSLAFCCSHTPVSVFVTVVTVAVLSCQKLKDVESIIKIVELNGDDLVRDYSNEIERMLGSKMKSVKVRPNARARQ